MQTTTALLTTDIPVLPFVGRGKVRDSYDIEEMHARLPVVTDRISAFDVVMPNGIPDKGRVLNQMTLFWLEKLAGICPNHLITGDFERFPVKLLPYRDQLEGRSMIVKKLEILPIEAIVRGYITGSGWKSYKKDRTVCGIQLPDGLVESEKLPEPIFTPSTKAETGHDENVSFGEAMQILASHLGISRKMAENTVGGQMRDLSIKLYQTAADYARMRGIIIADTKFEFGLDETGGLQIVLADEVLTPDSSRFWDLETYKPGRGQDSFDKQYVRDYLEDMVSQGLWNKEAPGPTLPPRIVERTREKYLEAFERLTGKSLN